MAHPRDLDVVDARAALRYLYGAVSARLRGDDDAVALLISQALPEVPLGDLLEAGALSVAEQLRDVACSRDLTAPALLRVLTRAHTELVGGSDLHTVLLDGAAAYLAGRSVLWDTEGLCALAACPTATLESLTTVLAATLTWRARDLAVPPTALAERVCLGLAVRDAGLLRTSR